MTRQQEGRQIVRWHLYPDAAALYDRAARAIIRIAREATMERGIFRIVLSGGNTPRPLYERLCAMDAQWLAWHVYFSDERCVPRDDPGRNSLMAVSAWLGRVPIPASQIHPIPAERGPQAGAEAYEKVLGGIAEFDLVLLGLGEDGHTASLFPGAKWAERPGSPAVLAVESAPKSPALRVTLGAQRLSQTREAMVIVTGEAKRDAVVAWRAGTKLPVGAIRPAAGVDALLENSLGNAGSLN